MSTAAQTVQQLKQAIINAFQKAQELELLSREANIPDFTIETPADRSHGDLATNAAMVSARTFRLAPRKIAEIITNNINLENTNLARFEIAGPGFINFFYDRSFYAGVLEEIKIQGKNYGRSNYGEGKSVIVEFVSANPTSPMHIGNARGGALGDTLSSVLEYAGYEVKREFYVNDAGNQIEKFATSLEIRYMQLYKDGYELPEDAYHGQDIIDHAKNFADIYGDKFVEASSEERRKALVAYALPLNIQGLERDLMKYRIKYDRWFRESTLHNDGSVKKIVELLTEKGHTYEQDGAVWFKAAQFGADKDFVLVRSNGLPTYVVPDIAYHYDKLVTRNFDIAVDVLGADHHGYVPRLKAALTALGVDASKLDVVLMQMVFLVKDNQRVKLSKRSGKAITLVTLLDEIPIDAARFFFNLREANTPLEFDLDLAVEQSSKNPVYYVQYAHARICNILKTLEKENIFPTDCTYDDYALLTAPEEIELINKLSTFTDEIVSSAKDYDPSRITRYVYDVATLFHKFYNACHVKNDDTSLMQARLALCIATKTVIANILDMFKITAPESM